MIRKMRLTAFDRAMGILAILSIIGLALLSLWLAS
jgi:hypothetical protein